MGISDEPLLTDSFDRADEFRPVTGSTYVFGQTTEERSSHLTSWTSLSGTTFVQICEEKDTSITVKVAGETREVLLRSERQLADLWNSIPDQTVYLDITGLSHHVWAPLLKSLLSIKADVMAVYVEPSEYRYDPAPTESQIFDLSERIRGLAPLPGFAFLADSATDDALFVPMLGFEGRRLSYLVEQVQPKNDKIIPVIGVPGFRPDYPFHTYLGNRRSLSETSSWQRIEYVRASCPFGIFYLLERLAASNPKDVLRIAPIGTKPHALGSVLFKIVSKHPVDLVYDHPIRKQNRTRGADKLHVYYLSPLAAKHVTP